MGIAPESPEDIAMPRFQKRHPGGPGRPRRSGNAVNLLLARLAVEGAEGVVK